MFLLKLIETNKKDKKMKNLKKMMSVAIFGLMSVAMLNVNAQDMTIDESIVITEIIETPTTDGIVTPLQGDNKVYVENQDRKDKLIQNFLITKSKYFRSGDLMYIKQKLATMDEDQIMLVMSLDYVNPTTNLVVSILVGSLGVDRFLIGQVGLGVLKLVTFGGLGVWTIVDWFLIKGLTKKYNFKLFNEAVMLM